MASYCKITIIGNLGKDPEMREVQGRKVTNFNVATNKSYTDTNGKKVEQTNWFRCAAWNRLAEITNQYLKKGSQVFIEGELSAREYLDQNGVNRTSLEVLVRDMQLLGGKEDSSDSQSYQSNAPSNTASQQPPNQANEPSPTYGGSGTENDDDLPF